jgi:hypothetical protein
VRDGGCYYIYKSKTFPSIPQLIDHYKTTPINPEGNARLINPVSDERTHVPLQGWIQREGAAPPDSFPEGECNINNTPTELATEKSHPFD